MLPNYCYYGELESVTDGDTIEAWIDLGFGIWIFKKLRLLRIDTPELRGTSAEVKAKAYEAKAFVVEALSHNPYTLTIKTESSDSFGRYLAEVYYTDEAGIQQNLSDRLLAEGLAVIY